MGRVKDWMIEMEQDASDMTLAEWTAKHGEANVNVYEAVRREADYLDADGIFRVADNPATTISTMERDRISKLCEALNGIEGPDAQLESVLRQAQEELQLLLSKIKVRGRVEDLESAAKEAYGNVIMEEDNDDQDKN